MVVELYSTNDCRLCDQARKILKKLQREYAFELREIKLAEDHPKFNDYALAVPVAVVNGVRQFSGQLSENQLRAAITEGHRPTARYYAAKFLEALGFITVFFGLIYGMMGNMWIDLYFFLSGLGVFGLGRLLERRETRKIGRTTQPQQA